MGDEAWRDQPKLMSQRVVAGVAEALSEQYQRQGLPFSVVLHGGEPLMLGAARLDEFCSTLRQALPHPCGLHIQTNGLLLSDAIVDVLVAHDVGISVSMDGPKAIHDRFRVDHRNRGSHERVAQAIAGLVKRADARRLFAGVLAVIDPQSEPIEVYEALKATGTPSIDFLVRDGNWDQLPFAKRSPTSTEYGSWLSRLLHTYLADSAPPRVRILDDMLRLLLGGASQKEGIGTTDYGILVIEPDGRIDKNDTLKVAHATADQFDRPWSILSDSLSEFLESPAYDRYYRQQRALADQCRACPDLSVCGGGMVAHRWSEARGFDNPTIFCADQRALIADMRGVLAGMSSKADA